MGNSDHIFYIIMSIVVIIIADSLFGILYLIFFSFSGKKVPSYFLFQNVESYLIVIGISLVFAYLLYYLWYKTSLLSRRKKTG